MIRITDTALEQYLDEDVPYFDLTTHLLGIGEKSGEIEYFTRENCILCGTEEAIRIMEKLDLRIITSLPSGTELHAGQTFLIAQGKAAELHAAWKVCLNMFDHCSAIATKTRRMVKAAQAVKPDIALLTTRKSMPGSKALVTKAIITGGATPHRLGLSETVLVFKEHQEFLGSFEEFIETIVKVKNQACEKKIFVEADASQAIALARAGVDGIQFDKIAAQELTELVPKLRALHPSITLVAAGGIHEGNAAEYAATGVNGLVTTSLFSAKPLDMSVRMRQLT